MWHIDGSSVVTLSVSVLKFDEVASLSSNPNGSGSNIAPGNDPMRDNSMPSSSLTTAAASSAPPRERKRRRRRRSRLEFASALRHPAFLVVAAVVFLLTLWGGFETYSAVAAYRNISADARVLKSYENRDPASLTIADLRTMQAHFADIDENLRRADRATSLPLLNYLVRELPWIGPRYTAGRQLIVVSQSLATAGEEGTRIAAATMSAYDATGLTPAEPASDAPTWLDVLARERESVVDISTRVANARAERQRIDVALLPGRVRAKVDDIDLVLDRYDYETLAADTLPAVEAALGADGPTSYWVLFPNPEELRPAGGFPGTGALVTFDRGQLVSYEFHDMKQVSDDYLAQRTEILPAPVPIDTYLFDNGFLPHDTVWWADFPRLGQDFMRMYAELDMPEIEGVIAIQPSVVAGLLGVVGNVTVNVDGEDREITPENVLLEMERQRITRRAGGEVDATHKDVLFLVGTEIMEQLKRAGRGELRQATSLMRMAADQRDIQVYSTNDAVMNVLDERHWSGRLEPDPDVPTLAITFANVVATKASLMMFPSVTLDLGDVQDGMQEATVDIELQHRGTNDADPFYAGFQRWWIQISLPAGSEVVSSKDTPQSDPDAPNGGAYLVEIFPQQTGEASVTFRMPTTNQLLFRRQPGSNLVELTIDGAECPSGDPVRVAADVVLNLAPDCD